VGGPLLPGSPALCECRRVMTALLLVCALADPGLGGMYELTGFIPPDERLAPCRVELEHRFLGPDDQTWTEEVIGVALLSHLWGDGMREMGFGVPYCAPVPLTRDQALLRLPCALAVEGGAILSSVGEHALTYNFDELDRTVTVDWDPVADSGVYTFRYFYEGGAGVSAETRPIWIVPESPEGE